MDGKSREDFEREAPRWLRDMMRTTDIRREAMEMIGSVIFTGDAAMERRQNDRRFALADKCCKTFVEACDAQEQALALAAGLLDENYDVVAGFEAAERIFAIGIHLGGEDPPCATEQLDVEVEFALRSGS